MPDINYRKKLSEARLNNSIFIQRLRDMIGDDIKDQLSAIIQNQIIDHTDPTIFDMQGYVLNRSKQKPQDIQLKIVLVPMYSPVVDEIRKDLYNLSTYISEYEMSDKSRELIKKVYDAYRKLDLTVKYRVEFHDENGKIELSD